jgi:hypothetical protein
MKIKIDTKNLPLFEDDGKKTERITFAASEELKEELERLRKALNRESISALVVEYVIECAFRDLGKLELMKARGDRRFVDIG